MENVITKRGPLVNPARTENIEAILQSLSARGVEYDLIDGVFNYCDDFCVLTESEETGLAVIRPSLSEYLRLRAGLCIACAGEPRKATRPNYPAKLREKHPPLVYSPSWCERCYPEAGR